MVAASAVVAVVAATVARARKVALKPAPPRLVMHRFPLRTKWTRAMRATRTATMKVPKIRKILPVTAPLSPRAQKGLMASAAAVVAVVAAVAVVALEKTAPARKRLRSA